MAAGCSPAEKADPTQIHPPRKKKETQQHKKKPSINNEVFSTSRQRESADKLEVN
jgi:hypothetical protein